MRQIKLNANRYSNVGLVPKTLDLNSAIKDYLIVDKKTSSTDFTEEEK